MYLPILLLQMTLTKQHEANLEAQNTDLAGALAVVHVEQPVDRQIQA